MTSNVRRGLLAVFLATALHACGGCGSKTEPICPPGVDCGETVRQCAADGDCCPSQHCSSGVCVNDKTTCNGPSACGVAGQVCKPESATSGTDCSLASSRCFCTFDTCDAQGACANPNLTCFNGFCVGAPPCNGGCPSVGGQKQVCVTATNWCSVAPVEQTGSCSLSCGPGKMLVLSPSNNTRGYWSTCSLAAELCECADLPALVINDASRHSSLALTSQHLYVSAYDGQYGDLVLHSFTLPDLTRESNDTPKWPRWIDGVPSSTDRSGNLNGPRGGITLPGPDVGQYTSIASPSSSPLEDLYISYAGVNPRNGNHELRFTGRYNQQSFSPPVVLDGTSKDGLTATADTGFYTSIALTGGGVPAIAYFQKAEVPAGATQATGLKTGLYYIVAKTAQPTSPDQWWAPVLVDGRRRTPPCDNACKSNEACAQDPATSSTAASASCHATATVCAPACTGGAVCVFPAGTLSGSGGCLAQLREPAYSDVPPGTGLMPSLQFLDDRPVIAYYDSVAKVLKAVLGARSGAGAGGDPGFALPVTIDGAQPNQAPRDVGRWPSLAINNFPVARVPRIAISYQDATRQSLLLYAADALIQNASSTNIHVLDDGRAVGNEPARAQTFPGTQSAVQFGPSGSIAVAYQDGTLLGLLFRAFKPLETDPARQLGPRTPLSTGGTAGGFWPRMVVDRNGTAYVTSATVKAATAQKPANTLSVTAISSQGL